MRIELFDNSGNTNITLVTLEIQVKNLARSKNTVQEDELIEHVVSKMGEMVWPMYARRQAFAHLISARSLRYSVKDNFSLQTSMASVFFST